MQDTSRPFRTSGTSSKTLTLGVLDIDIALHALHPEIESDCCLVLEPKPWAVRTFVCTGTAQDLTDQDNFLVVVHVQQIPSE